MYDDYNDDCGKDYGRNSMNSGTGYGNEASGSNTDNSGGYINAGSSGTGSANRYEGANGGYGNSTGTGSTGSYSTSGSGSYGTYRSAYSTTGGEDTGRTHYTSYRSAASYNSQANPGPGNTRDARTRKPQTEGKKFWKKALAAVVAGVLFGGAAAGAGYGVYRLTGLDEAVATIAEAKSVAANADRATLKTAVSDTTPQATVKTTVAATNTDLSGVAKVAADAMPSVVTITNDMTIRGQTWWGQPIEQTEQSAGSGIIVGENGEELLIVTNQHVISDATELSIQFVDGSEAEANLKGQDEAADIAVVAVPFDSLSDNTIDSIRVATLGDSDKLKVGEQVVAIGNAMGYGQTTTTGIVSALDREGRFSTGNHKVIQTDAAINPGNSGGALLNMNGELVGINEAKAGQVLSNGATVEGMGYAIPISTVKSLIDELMNKDTKVRADESNQSFLGIGGVDVTSDVSGTYDIPEGIYIAQVDQGSAAEKAGLVRGDVITKFDGETVTSMSELKDLMQYYEAGKTVELTIQTQSDGGYTEKVIEVTLGKKPQDVQ